MTNKTNTLEINLTARKLATFSKNVARQRKAAGLTKTEFASHTSVSRDTIRRVENLPSGYIPSNYTIESLAFTAGSTVKDILTRKLSFQ